MAKSPAVILFDSNGVAMAVEDGVAIPAGAQALLAAGSDGTDAHFVLVDASGRPIVVGAGGAGTPAGGVVSIQGVFGGTAVPVTGTVLMDNPSVGANNAAAPGSSIQVGGSDGINLQAIRVFDADTSAENQYLLGVGLRKSAFGGSVEAGTVTDPLRVDPTGLTTQPISGAVTVGGSVSVSSLVPGVGPLNLGKEEDAQAGSGDTGVAMLAVYQPDTFGVSANTIGHYATLNVDDKGRLRVSPGGVVIIDTFDSIDGISGTSTDVENIAVSTNHVRGTGAVSFNIVNSPANTAFGLIQKTIPTVNLAQLATGITFVQLLVFIPNLSNVNNVVIRLGTDASNYNSWNLPVASGTAVGGVWQSFRAALGTCNASVGTGWDLSSITYYAVGLEMATANNALNGVVVDSLWAIGGQVHGSDTTSEISSVVSTAKIDIAKVAGRAVDVDRGAATTATMRVAIADDDTNLAAINTKLTSGVQQTKITDGSTLAAVKPASTAAVAGDAALVVAVSPNNTLRVDPTGTTTQPISAAALPLPTGAATQTTLASRLADTTFMARINSLGQKTSAASTPVVLPSDQTAIPVTDNGGSLTVDSTQLPAALVSGRLDSNIGAWLGSAAPTVGQKTMAASVPVAIASDQGTLRIDPIGTTTQPISAASLPLPAGAATETTLSTRLADATFTARISTLGQKTSTSSTPVVLASDQTSIPVTDNGGSLTVDGAVTANIGTTNGLAVDATLTGGAQTTRITNGTTTVAVKAASTAAVATDPALVVAISPNNTVAFSAAALPLPNGAATEATLGTRLADATFTARVNTLGQKTSAQSTPTVLASDHSPILVSDAGGSLTVDGTVTSNQGVAALLSGAWPMRLTDGTTMVLVDPAGRLQVSVSSPSSTQSSVAASASSVQLLAGNTARTGATIFNDSSAIMYLKLGTTASTTSFTVRLVSQAYYEVPFGYEGRIDAIWATASGNARITEFA